MEIMLYAMFKEKGKSATHFQFQPFDAEDLELNKSRQESFQVIVPRGSQVVGDKLVRESSQDGTKELTAEEVHALADQSLCGFQLNNANCNGKMTIRGGTVKVISINDENPSRLIIVAEIQPGGAWEGALPVDEPCELRFTNRIAADGRYLVEMKPNKDSYGHFTFICRPSLAK